MLVISKSGQITEEELYMSARKSIRGHGRALFQVLCEYMDDSCMLSSIDWANYKKIK